jgi:hypothetical protein
LLPAAGCLLLLTGCLGGSSSGSGNGNGTPPPDPMEPTLASIQQHVFSPICTQCHSGGAAPEGLRLESGQSHGHLVEVESRQVDLYRVEPGNPDDSYLIHKLEGTNAVGDRMPQGGPFLSQSDINVIRQWITDGAEASSAEATTGTASVTGGWPMDGSSLPEPPHNIVVIFDRELDTSLLHSNSVTLSRLDDSDPSNPEFHRVDHVGMRISSLSPTTVVLEVPQSAWTSGHYEVRILGSGSAPVATRSGEIIDGDGDGQPGGDFVRIFELRETH